MCIFRTWWLLVSPGNCSQWPTVRPVTCQHDFCFRFLGCHLCRKIRSKSHLTSFNTRLDCERWASKVTEVTYKSLISHLQVTYKSLKSLNTLSHCCSPQKPQRNRCNWARRLEEQRPLRLHAVPWRFARRPVEMTSEWTNMTIFKEASRDFGVPPNFIIHW